MQTLRCLNPAYDAYLCRSKTPAQWFVQFHQNSFYGDVRVMGPDLVHVVYDNAFDEQLGVIADHTRIYSDIRMKLTYCGDNRHEHRFDYNTRIAYPDYPSFASWFSRLFKKKGS